VIRKKVYDEYILRPKSQVSSLVRGSIGCNIRLPIDGTGTDRRGGAERRPTDFGTNVGMRQGGSASGIRERMGNVNLYLHGRNFIAGLATEIRGRPTGWREVGYIPASRHP